jgi:hypothetical protein
LERQSKKSLVRSGMQRPLALVEHRDVDAAINAKLDRLTRSVKDLANLVLYGSARKDYALLQQPGGAVAGAFARKVCSTTMGTSVSCGVARPPVADGHRTCQGLSKPAACGEDLDQAFLAVERLLL